MTAASHPTGVRVLVPALAICVLGAGCSSGNTKRLGLQAYDPDRKSTVSREKVVIPHKPPKDGRRRPGAGGSLRDRRAVSADDAGWEEKLALARDYAEAGYDEAAVQILDVCLAQQAPAPYYAQMRALKTSLQLRRTEDTLLRVEAHGVRDYVPFGQEVDFLISLENVSNVPVTLKAPVARATSLSPTALTVDIRRIDRDVYASQMERNWTQNVFLHARGDKPLTIAPGETHEIAIRIPAQEVGDRIAGVRIVELGGMLRPTRLKKGEEGRTVRLRIRPGRVVVLPHNYEPLVLDPLRSMRTAVQAGAAQHLLIAAEFVPRRQRVEAVRVLAYALSEADPSLRRASLGALSTLREHATGARLRPLVEPLMEALDIAPARAEAVMEGIAALADVRFAPDPRLWRDWWQRSVGEDAKVPPPGSRPAPEADGTS